jgi:hypothetical protein
MEGTQSTDAEKNIEVWKVKKLIKRLEAARGNGTSMISLIIRKSLWSTSANESLTEASAEGPDLPSSEDVSRRIRMFQIPFMFGQMLTIGIGYCFEYQVSS